jgi:hypothetical protein
MDDIDIEKDNVIRLARKYGFSIKEELVFGEMEYIDLVDQQTQDQELAGLISSIGAVTRILGEKLVYKYQGPSPERNFCKELIRLNKFYTKEEINIMSFQGRNKSFGHNRQNYSIWKYKGGVNCKHRWVSYTVIRNKKGEIIQSVRINNAPGIAGDIAKSSNNFYRFR